MGQVREAEAAAGRPRGSVKVQAAAPAHVGDLADWPRADPLVPGARQQPRRRPRQQVPARAAARVADRLHPRPEGYDYHHHAEVGSSNAGFVGDEVTDRFCVLGSVDEHVAKLHELAAAGVDQFNIYLMNGDEEDSPRGLRPGDHPGDARRRGEPALTDAVHRDRAERGPAPWAASSGGGGRARAAAATAPGRRRAPGA